MRNMVNVEKGESSYGVFVPDLPSCIAVGETEQEEIVLIQEAVQFYLEDLQSGGRPISQSVSKSTFVTKPSLRAN